MWLIAAVDQQKKYDIHHTSFHSQWSSLYIKWNDPPEAFGPSFDHLHL